MKFPFLLASEREFDAIGFGRNAVNHLILVPEYPAFDTKVRLLEHTRVSGGETSMTMVALRRLGLNTACAGRFGSDADGQFGLQALKTEGVNIEFAEVPEDTRSGISFVFIDARNGEQTIMWDSDRRLDYGADEAPVGLAARGRLLYVDGKNVPASARMARAAHDHGTLVTARVNDVNEAVPELLSHIDLLVTAREFPHRLTGIADERTSLVELKARYGCAAVCMTLVTGGAIVYCGGEFVEAPSYQAPGTSRDASAPSDAFHAGLLYGILTGEDVETSLRMGNAATALSVRELGGRVSLPEASALTEFLVTQTVSLRAGS